ncbi:acyl-CoA dehydrogenase family protein [Streptomyces eurythermus]|uniref:acyl-CoA dehydrogenase family protein n=1 Tax=Streptomyces eurythermus TaxID=42237 RepID=UPI0036F56870
MNVTETPDQTRFRHELRTWLDEHVRPQWREPGFEEQASVALRFAVRRKWHRTLATGGWIGVEWPVEYGGRGLTPVHGLILSEELARARALPIADWVGVELVAPTLLRCGSHEQRNRYLPGIKDGSQVWCQGFSEPAAGSDLAAVTTVATRTADGYRISGHKRWTSWAQFADFALVLARTGDPAERHRTLSCFIVPLGSPGVTIEPIPMLYGDAEECDLHLDDVEVPADALVGEENKGWRTVMTSLTLARGSATLIRIAALKRTFDGLTRDVFAPGVPAAGLPDDSVLRSFTLLHARLEALGHLARRKMGEMEDDGLPGQIASTEKLLWARLSSDIARFGMETQDLDGIVEPDPTGVSTGWRREMYRAMANEIEGGTNAIQRTTIARHVLKLPC